MLPLSYDANYDVTVCTDCSIGLPFNWIESHLKENHGIRTTSEKILEHIDQAVPSLDSTEVRAWLDTHQSIENAIKGIPVVDGLKCSLCIYYTMTAESMRVHFHRTHRGESGTTSNVKIQRPFKGWFKKYIEVMEPAEANVIREEAWKDELNRRFENALRIDSSGGNPETTDMRLMNAFIAKVRYVRL